MNSSRGGEEIDSLFNLAQILDIDVDRRTLAVLLELMEAGVHPESLVDIITEFRSGGSAAPTATK